MKIHHTLIIIALALTSCSLNETPRSELPEDVAYTSKETLYLNTVATLYNYIGGYEEGQGLQGAIGGVYDLQTFGSDEAMIPLRGVDWYDGGLWQDMYKHSWTAGHDLVKNPGYTSIRSSRSATGRSRHSKPTRTLPAKRTIKTGQPR